MRPCLIIAVLSAVLPPAVGMMRDRACLQNSSGAGSKRGGLVGRFFREFRGVFNMNKPSFLC
jgi:hypothetical protein